MTINGINEKIAQQIISYNKLMAIFINLLTVSRMVLEH